MFSARQRFSCRQLEDWQSALEQALRRGAAGGAVRPGMRIAVTAGSRGIEIGRAHV